MKRHRNVIARLVTQIAFLLLLSMSLSAFAEPEDTSDDWFESLKGNVGLTVGDLTPRYGDDAEGDKSESLEPESIPDGVATIKKDAIDIWLDSLPGAVGKVIGDLNPRFDGSSKSKQGETGTAASQDPNDPQVAALIREWISVAEPPENATDGADLHYNEWGVRLGSVAGGVIKGTPGKPDDVGARTSPEYLWGIRSKLDSVDRCTLEEFVMARLEQHDIKQCTGRYKPMVADLVGKTKKAAEKLISQRRLKPKVLPGEPAPSKGANGKVQRQEPASGTSLARGQTVTIWIHSPYVDRRTIPDLIGLSPKDAKARLKEANLKPKLRPGDPAPTKAKSGKVQAQTPEPGTRIKPGAEVQLIVYSPYVAIRKLPDLTSLSSKKAKARLAELGLKAKLRPGSPAPDSSKSGKVEGQKPAPGTEVKPGALVELFIHAPHVAQIEVPNLVGLSVEQAYTKLESMGLIVEHVNAGKPPSRREAGLVRQQSPGPGIRVKAGTLVTLQAYSAYAPTREEQVAAYDCSKYPGSRAYWDDQKNQPLCGCPGDYMWNSNKTACITYQARAKEHCSQWRGSVAILNQQTGEYECRCPEGQNWSDEQKSCIGYDAGAEIAAAIFEGLIGGIATMQEEKEAGRGQSQSARTAPARSGNPTGKQVTFKNPTVNGVPLDNCIRWGGPCGQPAADAYCKSRGYPIAVDYKVVSNKPPTQPIEGGRICVESFCGPMTVVVCRK